MSRPENASSLAKSGSERKREKGGVRQCQRAPGLWLQRPHARPGRQRDTGSLSEWSVRSEREDVEWPLWASTQLPGENKDRVSFGVFFSKPKEDPAVLSADSFFLVPWKMISGCFRALLFFQAEGVCVLLDWANVSCNNIDSDDGKWRCSL